LYRKWENEEFEKKCKSLEGFKYTKYLGLVSLGEVCKYIKRANIGVCILYPVKNYLTSMPIKAYEYMACSLPMVMSDFLLWKEMFGRCALFVNPYTPNDIADKIRYLLDNPEETKKLGAIGKELVIREYNWRTEGKKLTCLYTKILHGK
jgi:glycosyltransferase involved in cell wall biosynthesis